MAIGIQISEQVIEDRTSNPGLRLDSDLEIARRKKEILDKEIEKVELEASAIEIRKKIDFLKHTSGPSNVVASFLGQGGTHGNNAAQENCVSGATTVPNGSNKRKSTSHGMDPLHGAPIHERYKQLVFFGILGYPNVNLGEIRKKLPKFTRNNVITSKKFYRFNR